MDGPIVKVIEGLQDVFRTEKIKDDLGLIFKTQFDQRFEVAVREVVQVFRRSELSSGELYYFGFVGGI